MGRAFDDVWIPEVENEFLELMNESRDVAFDAGNHFRALEAICERGVDAAWRPLDIQGRCSIYVMYARYALMFFAVCGREVAPLKWMAVGTEYAQELGLRTAKDRGSRIPWRT